MTANIWNILSNYGNGWLGCLMTKGRMSKRMAQHQKCWINRKGTCTLALIRLIFMESLVELSGMWIFEALLVFRPLGFRPFGNSGLWKFGLLENLDKRPRSHSFVCRFQISYFSLGPIPLQIFRYKFVCRSSDVHFSVHYFSHPLHAVSVVSWPIKLQKFHHQRFVILFLVGFNPVFGKVTSWSSQNVIDPIPILSTSI